MKIACVSAANIEAARHHSASVRACQLVRDLLLAEQPAAEVEIIPLIDYEMKPCRMCGRCLETQRCARDEAFNQVFEKLIGADGIFVVVPHYAPLPSKLMILFEKMEEIAFLSWSANPSYHFPLSGKPAGVIGHGGQPATDEVLSYYRRALVEPVAQALGSVSMKVISAGKGWPSGAAFGIRSLSKPDDSIFVDIQHDWDDIRARVAPLVRNVAAALLAGQ
jgi:multimeric flavodoxin WrbA